MTIELSGAHEDYERKIRAGLEQLDRGEGMPESELDDYLQRLKARAVSLG